MSYLGMKIYEKALMKTISDLKITPDGDGELHITFDDNTGIVIWDNGRDCCESRYMITDDNLKDFIGSKFMDMELRNGPNIDDGECHEQLFLLINTSYGTFTVVTHNEHNGYYGGFSVSIREA
jgi:hypothetical protein